jgi:signal transduction histidine kinase
LARALEGVGGDRRQGLGLPLARQLIEAHGGTLDLVSQPGQGVTAVVELS